MRRLRVFSIIAILSVFAASARALIQGGGKEPVTDNNWAAGSVELANLKSRLAYWEGPPFGGGQFCFLYRGDTAAFNTALVAFARLKAPDLLLVVHEGPGSSNWVVDTDNNRRTDDSVDWEFTVWTPENFYSLYDNPTGYFDAEVPEFRGELDPPRLDVYITPGRVDWTGVKVPPGVKIDDQRATANGYKPGDGAVVRGVVYNMVTSKPVPGAEMGVEKYTDQPDAAKPWQKIAATTTDADGRFEVKQIPAGSCRVTLRCAGYAPRLLGYVTCSKDSLNTFTTRLAPAAALEGIVSDTSGKALANVKVYAQAVMALDGHGYPMSYVPEARTDVAGHFTLADLPKGHAAVLATAAGFYQLDSLRLYEVPAQKLELKMTATGTVHGRVILGPGKKASGINVNIIPVRGGGIGTWGGGATVKPDGTFVFENVPPDNYLLSTTSEFGAWGATISKDGPKTRTATVTAGQTVEVELPAP